MKRKQRDDEVVRQAQDNEMIEGCFGGEEIRIPIAIHPNIENGIIVINYPGCGGDIDGYNDKYRVLAEYVQGKVGAVVRSGNHYYGRRFRYPMSIQRDLEAIIDFAILHSVEICGSNTPAIYLMGFSAGGSAVAAVASRYPQVKKILLLNPSGDANEEDVVKGMAEYTGEVYIVGAADDEVVGPNAASFFSNLVKSASVKKVEVIPNCSHQFIGTENGKIMSKAPLWAFADDQTFPSPEGGIVLY